MWASRTNMLPPLAASTTSASAGMEALRSSRSGLIPPYSPLCSQTSCCFLPGRLKAERSEEHTSELQSHLNLVCRLLLEKKIQLTYTAWAMVPLARDLGDNGPPFRWDPRRRALLRAELDAAFFHLYAVSAGHADYILDTL